MTDVISKKNVTFWQKIPLAIAIAFTFSGTAVENSMAQTSSNNTEIEEVVTIGTRVAGRTATQTPVPVDVLTEDAIRKSGETETGPLLQKLAPSFNFTRTSISDGSDILRPATLRGLNPDHVLVLVNGKRRHSQAWASVTQSVGRGSAGTDLNAIPTSAIKRIEVLRDGAAAQYGSDAIAGVINIILKDQTDTTNIGTQWGQTKENDGAALTVSVNTGISIGEQGFLNLTAEFQDRDPTDRTDVSNRIDVFGAPKKVFRIGEAESESQSLFWNGEVPLAVGQVYFFGGLSDRKAQSTGFYRFPDQADRAVPSLYPLGFLPLQNSRVEDYSAAFGYRMEITDNWKLDTSIVTAQNKFSFGAENSVNTSLFIDTGSSPTSGDSGSLIFRQDTLNIDLSGDMDLGLNDTVYISTGLEYRAEEYEITAGDFASWSCGGGNGKNSVPVPNSKAIAACGFQGFPGYSPDVAGSIDRDSYAAYVDLESNLTDRLLIALALRYEKYDIVGEEITNKLSSRYEFTDSFAIRGAISTGFRAPALAQVGFTSITTEASEDGLTQTLFAAVGSDIPTAYGVKSLDHETSDNISFGIVWDVLENLTLTLDLYQVEIEDRIAVSGLLNGDGNAQAQAVLAANNVKQAQFYTNAVDSKTQGADFITTYDWDLNSYGTMTITGIAHYNKTEIKKINTPAGVAQNAIFPQAQVDLLETGQPRQRLSLNFDWQLDAWSTNLRFTRYGKVKTSGRTCSGVGIPDSVCALGDVSLAKSIESSAKVLTDLNVSYTFDNGLQLAVGGNNIFDEYPDELPNNAVFRRLSEGAGPVGPAGPGTGTFGNFKYPWESTPFGISGAFYYVSANYSF